MDKVKQLFNDLISGDEGAAFDSFKATIGEKMKTALDVKRVAVASDVFGDVNESVENLEEGVYDPAIFKAVFLAGGPGSGKSFTVGKTGLTALGFKIVNSDDKFEAAMRKAKMEMTPENIFSDEGQAIRGKAKTKTKKQQDIYLDGRLGLVIDGTGKDFAKIKGQAEKLKELGYEVSMILVNTDLETSLVRNRMRERSLEDSKVEKMWSAVQKNIGKFQAYFKDNFIVVDNSQGSNIEKATTAAYKKAAKFAKSKVKNPIANAWIDQQISGGR
jgi:shikimate kinase